MTDTEKVQKIEKYRKDFERALTNVFGVDADVTVALHDSTFNEYAAACAIGWEVRQNVGSTMAVMSKNKPGGTGDTVIYYHPVQP